jgi:type II secretory pathway pseudopilin PulG
MKPPDTRARRRGGFTIIELVLATALLSFLMIAVFALIDGSLRLWRKSETRRNLTEQAIGVMELLSHDLRNLEGGTRGDLLVEYQSYDTDGDGAHETVWPRIRLVRQASMAEMTRFAMLALEEEQSLEDTEEEPEPLEDETLGGQFDPDDAEGPALIEVCWVVVPAGTKDPDQRSEGLVHRGARPLGRVGDSGSYFANSFIRNSGVPRLEELDEVTGGLLWLGPLMATQTSIVHEEWRMGGELQDAATSWDAWNLARPDVTVHAWNQPGAGMPRGTKDHALLPRRIRFELEFERPLDRKRRTRTSTRIEFGDVAFDVDDGQRLPREGGFIKIDGEWMKLRSANDRRITVKRGVRGTTAMAHEMGAMIHWGLPLISEIPVATYREDWDL